MLEKKSMKQMWWGIIFGLLFIVAAVAAWLISGGTADTMGLTVLVVLGILMIILTVVKIKADRRYFLVMAVIGVVMVVTGTLGMLTGAIPAEGGSLISGGLVMILCGGLWLARHKEEKIVDERSQKIGTYGTALSWYIIFMAVVILYWLDMLGVLEVQASTILGGLMFLMIGSALFFQWYFNRQGDVY
ncbi:hypothetical protein [Methanogenium organophilum]|uniref:Uncharacterized protein n=1 Tax=Methanogenium organophilum TaxID=2199 RepID=A0A9X9S243_METOG|nr:hypothetical protein [Methanogenium organophilum]WAI00133.1 hypothetical protein OU421_06730 [Methanogenium organophilum]